MTAAPSALNVGDSLGFTCPSATFIHYRLSVQDCAQLLRITVQPRGDLYVSNLHSQVSRMSYVWKSDREGKNEVEIHPCDERFVPGDYSVGVYSESKTECQLSVETVAVAPIHTLTETYEGEAGEWKYFRYAAKDPGESRLRVTVTSENIGAVSVYVSMTVWYPSEARCTWYLSASELLTKEVTSNEGQLDPYVAMPKQYQKPAVKWNKRSSPETFRNYPHSHDSLIFCIDTEVGEGSKSDYFLAVKNASGRSSAVHVSVTEVQLSRLLTEQHQKLLQTFQQISADYEGAAVSHSERERLGLPHYGQFTYGEVDFASLIPLLSLCDIQEGEVFWDLGCGAGKCVLATALLHPELAAVKGVELLAGLFDTCSAMVHTCEQLHTPCAKITVTQGDILEVSWLDADLIYISSLCFPESLLARVADTMQALKPHTRILSLKAFLSPPLFRLRTQAKVKMTWGPALVYIYEKA